VFAVTAAFTATNNVDPELQVLLGGDNGLRGYPLRYRPASGALLSVEERFFTDFYPWRLFRVGYAAFFDVGRVSAFPLNGDPTIDTMQLIVETKGSF
jgi:hypothetical protein